ncbi:endonuclease subunit [uncultured Caudovirales phage]|uniref:Endonuclease subunit n=1 Tax=uncultured Caudovirales phage TaxID=2100421 RepID=A0A6J7WTY3_9CAUD|nr:endonuclease subunit [uncultured Caudovirales phage]
MRVAIITDQHFGARNDSIAFLDFYQKFYDNTFFPTIDAAGIDTVLILGDTFDRRKYVNFYSLQRAKEMFFDKLEERGIRVHMLAGNHDTYYKNTNDVNSPDLLLTEYGNIDVIHSPENIVIAGTKICMMPWICPDNYTESIDHMKATDAEICMGHFEINGFAMYRGMESHEGLAKDTFDKFDMVFSGHYHHKSDDGHIYYLGNPYELTWQDYNDTRGFHLFDLNTRELEFIPNLYTMFARVEYNDKETEPINLDSLDLKDMYVKLIVVNKTDFYKFDKFIQKLYSKGCHEIKIIEDLSEFEDGEIGEEINLEDTLSVLSNYVDSINTDVDKEQVKTYMRTLYTEAVNIEVV